MVLKVDLVTLYYMLGLGVFLVLFFLLNTHQNQIPAKNKCQDNVSMFAYRIKYRAVKGKDNHALNFKFLPLTGRVASNTSQYELLTIKFKEKFSFSYCLFLYACRH